MKADDLLDVPRPRSTDPEVQRFYDVVQANFKKIAAFQAIAARNSRASAVGSSGYYNGRNAGGIDQGSGYASNVSVPNAIPDPYAARRSGCVGNTTPSLPTDVAASGAFGSIRVTWKDPVFGGYKETEIWVSETTSLDDAVLAGTSSSPMFKFLVPAIDFSNQENYEVKRYVWVRHMSYCEGVKPGIFSDMVEVTITPAPEVLGAIFSKNASAIIASLGLDQTLSQISDRLASLDAGIQTQQNVTDGLTQQIETVVAKANSNTAAIEEEATTRANADSLLSQQIQTATVKANDAYAVAQSKVSAEYVDGKLTSTASIKTDVNGNIVGLGIYNNGNPAESGIAFNADNFYITNTSGQKATPFSVSGGKVYAKDLYVETAKISDLESLTISADKITAGTLNADTVTFNSQYGNFQFGGLDNNGARTGVTISTKAPSSVALYVNGAFGVNPNSPTYLGTTYTGYLGVAGNLSVTGTISGTVYSALRAESVYTSGNAMLQTTSSNSWAIVQSSDGNLVHYKNGDVFWSSASSVSDSRLKDIIGDTETSGLHRLNRFRVVDFTWKKDTVHADGGKKHTGFIAQEVKEIEPTFVDDSTGTNIIDNSKFIPLLVKAVQELTVEITKLKKRIAALENNHA